MSRAFIEQFSVKGYGCIRDASLRLTPLHALIGPNDSGKSSLLRALELTTKLLRHVAPEGNEGPLPKDFYEFLGFESLEATFPAPKAYVRFDKAQPAEGDHPRWVYYEDHLALPSGHQSKRRWATDTEDPGFFSGQTYNLEGVSQLDREFVRNTLGRQSARFVRFDPDSLRKDSPLLVGPDEARLLNEQGFGLPAVYDAILNRQDDSMKRIVEQARELFPTVKVVRLKTTSPNTKAIEVELKSGARVPARFLSEGLLYYLAFAALPYLEPTTLLLVEEPENGLHPARIADVVRLLREMSKTTQVLMATHSPLVINELGGDEVSVVTRTESEGTKVTLLRDTPNFEKRSQAYALGELWVSYADGETESALLQGGPPP